jgi:hypothetical protein
VRSLSNAHKKAKVATYRVVADETSAAVELVPGVWCKERDKTVDVGGVEAPAVASQQLRDCETIFNRQWFDTGAAHCRLTSA